MKQIGSNLSSAKNVASGMELSYYSGIDTTPSPPHIYEGMSPGAQSAAWARYRRQLQESRNRKANYNKLQSFCSGTAGRARSSLEEFYDSLEEIYKKHVIEFENTDDDYKREATRVYDACTSAGERFWDIGTKLGKLVNDINDGIDAAVYDFVSGILGLAFTLAKIDMALRVAVVTVPLGITPQWVKDTGKEAVEGLEGIAAILRNPGRALASLGQQVTDTVEEKGIAYALSYVTADIVIGILVDKGIGKIRGMNKADDLAKLSTKVDDVVDVADDLGDAAKVVDKIDDVVSVGGLEGGTGVKYSPINPCDEISREVAESFNGATFTKRVLTEDTVMYRVSGGSAREVGSYMSITPQGGGLQSQLDLALNPAWGNTTENVTKVIVPKGTTIYEGVAAPQNILDSLGNAVGTLPGGGSQIYIPKVEAEWFQ